jgi:hypothetical protein
VLFWLACSPSASEHENDTLLRAGTRRVTEREFLQAFELAKTAHPDSLDPSSPALQEARRRLLEELVVELVLLSRADTVGVGVSESELDAAVAAVQTDYPPGVFEQTLAEAAVPLEAWRQRLRSRLLVDKLVDLELRPRTAITPEEVAAYYHEHYRGKAAGADSDDDFLRLQQTIVADLGRRKLEQAFGPWVDGLKQTYPVEVNHELWARMLNPASTADRTPAGK